MIKSNMPSEKMILIIDDHLNAAKVFKANLESLNKNLNIILIPSGEEALLELKKSTFDLVIADIILPGISGFKLLKTIKKNSPKTKVFIVSGVADPGIKKKIAKAGADAFFYKPVDIAEFLDAVERSLGFIGTILTPELQLENEAPDEIKTPGLPGKLSKLKNQLDAQAIFLLGKVGQILMSDGELPQSEFDSDFIPRFFQLINIRETISKEMNALAPRNLHVFRIADYDIVSIRFVSSYILLIFIPKDKYEVLNTLYESIDEIYGNLKNLGVTTVLDNSILDSLSLETDEVSEIFPMNEDALLAKALDTNIDLEDANSFWEEFKSQKSTPDTDPESISYDQAKDLGVDFTEE